MLHDPPTSGTMYWIDLDTGNSVEPRLRLGQGATIEFTLDGPVIDVQADVSGAYSGTITVTVSGDDLIVTVEFGDVFPEGDDCYTITLSGDVSDTQIIRMLEGDVNRDKSVSTADASSIKARLGDALPGVDCQYDINRDGSISTADRSSAKARLGDTLSC